MPPSADILAWSLIGAAAITILYTTAMAIRLARGFRNIPRLLEPRPEPSAQAQSVCVICAVRDEEDSIAGHARAILDQTHTNLRLVVVLDRCKDATEAVLKAAATTAEGVIDPRLEIIHNSSCPPGFNGKASAIHESLAHMESAHTADLLLFTDADARPDPRCIDTATATLDAFDADALSLFATMPARRWWDVVVQPVLVLELMRVLPLDRINDDDDPRTLSNGPFILVRRDAYFDAGGHERARRHVMEDRVLAETLRDAGKRVRTIPSRGLLHIDRALSWSEYRRRWIRNFAFADHHPGARAFGVLIGGVALPLACVGAAVLGAARLAADQHGGALLLTLALAALALIGAALLVMYRIQDRPTGAVFLYPVGSLIAASILLGASRALATGRIRIWARDALQEEPTS